VPVENEGIATIVLGPPAAGKSMFSEQLARERHAAVVDPDEAKKIIPEYDGGAGADAVHAESCELAGLVAKRLAEDKANLVFPRIGANPNSIRELISELDGLGYRVDLVHIHVAKDEAFRRMIARCFTNSHYKMRLIPPEYFDMVGDKPRRTYYILKAEGLVHEAVEVDANGPLGQHVIIDGADTELASYLRP
jgi:zeta toxin